MFETIKQRTKMVEIHSVSTLHTAILNVHLLNVQYFSIIAICKEILHITNHSPTITPRLRLSGAPGQAYHSREYHSIYIYKLFVNHTEMTRKLHCKKQLWILMYNTGRSAELTVNITVKNRK